MLPPMFHLSKGQRSHFGCFVVCALQATFLDRFFSFKFCIEVHHSKIYTPIVLSNAAPSIPSFIGSKVIFWWMSCVALQATFLEGFNFFLYGGALESNLHSYCFWWCCPQWSIFYRVKWHILVDVMRLCRSHFLTDFCQIVWRCIIVKSTHMFFFLMLPTVFHLL